MGNTNSYYVHKFEGKKKKKIVHPAGPMFMQEEQRTPTTKNYAVESLLNATEIETRTTAKSLEL